MDGTKLPSLNEIHIGLSRSRQEFWQPGGREFNWNVILRSTIGNQFLPPTPQETRHFLRETFLFAIIFSFPDLAWTQIGSPWLGELCHVDSVTQFTLSHATHLSLFTSSTLDGINYTDTGSWIFFFRSWILLAGSIAIMPRKEIGQPFKLRPGIRIIDLQGRGWGLSAADMPDCWLQSTQNKH